MGAPLLSIVELADRLNVPVHTLYAWRAKGIGPKALKLGRHLRYRPEDVEAYLDELAGDAA